MTIYWIVWISAITISFLISLSDYAFDSGLTIQHRKHTVNARLLFILAVLVLIIFAGCRYYVGTDFGGYYRYTNYLDFWESLKTLSEPGIRFVYSIAVRIHDSGQFCIFAVAAVTLGLQLVTIYRNTDRIGFALVLFTFTCWSACFNGVRQALASAVLFCGFSALRDRKFIRFSIFVLLAFLCHRSAIIMLLIYFIITRKVNLRNVLILIVVSSLVLLSYGYLYQFVEIFYDKTIIGTETYWSTEVNRLRILSDIAPAIFFLIVCRNKDKTPQMNFYLNLLIVGAVVSVTTMNSAALSRMNIYMMPFMIISIVELIKELNEKDQKLITVFIVLLYGFMEWYDCSNSYSLNNFQLRWIW